MSIFGWQYLLFLVEHGGWLVGLGEHVEEGRLLLPDLVVLKDPLLPLELVYQHTFSVLSVQARVVVVQLI
jgi:hypothetical protein